MVIASKCLNAFIVAVAAAAASICASCLVRLPLSFSFFQVVRVVAACPTCVVVIDLSLMGGFGSALAVGPGNSVYMCVWCVCVGMGE